MKTVGNISFINATLLQNIGFKVGAWHQEDISRRQQEQLTKVCSFPFSITVTWLIIHLHSLPPLMLPCFTHIIHLMCLSLLHPLCSLLMLQQQAERVSSFPHHSARYKADPLLAA